MLRALYTAASGMEAQQLNIDTIAHNLANINTSGFKQRRTQFQDLLYQNEPQRRHVEHRQHGDPGRTADRPGNQTGCHRR